MTTTDDTFEVRQRLESDLPGCMRLIATVHNVDRYPYKWPKDVRWLSPEYELSAWVLVRGPDTIVGHVSLQGLRRNEMSDLWSVGAGCDPDELVAISRLFVDPACRGLQSGRLLAETAMRYATKLGRRTVLDVAAHNQAAIHLYERMGFERVGMIEMKFDDDSVSIFAYIGPQLTECRRPVVSDGAT